jgi:hypothetical protein
MEVCYQESDTLSEQQNRLDAAFDILFDEIARREEASPQSVEIARLTAMHT